MYAYEVAIVGSGLAGLTAATEAAAQGARVLVAEAEDVVGGSSRLSHSIFLGAGTALQKAAGLPDDSPDELFREYMIANHWDVEVGAVRYLVDECGPAIEWLMDRGVDFLPDLIFAGDERVPRGHVPVGGGEAVIDVLHRGLKRDALVDIALRRRVDRLLVEDGRVAGLAVGDDVVRAPAVVIASGGFGNNPELVERYFPDGTHGGDWTWYIGAAGARGDAIGLCEGVGAHIAGFNRGHCVLRSNFSHAIETYLPGWLVVVDVAGERFYNEMSNPYLATEPSVLARGGHCFAIFDEATKRSAQPHTTIATKKASTSGSLQTNEDWIEPIIDQMLSAGRVVKADTVVELAVEIGVPVATLVSTLERYNDDVARGEDSLFLKSPAVLRPVATPPYYATELRMSMLALTSVGPRIDREARVLRPGGQPIVGLYAAGECAGGILGKVYLGTGNSVSNCLVFGRAAGLHAARLALDTRDAAQR